MNSQPDVIFKTVDDEMKLHIQQEWPSNAGDFIHLDENSFSLAALVEGVPVGVISAHRRSLADPLDFLQEAYISIIDILEEYRRIGIGSALIEAVIAWAKEQEVFQVGAWSMKTRVEALYLWRKFGFTFARIDAPQQLEAPYGFYVTKQI